MKEFIIVNGETHYRGSGKVLARALSLTEAKKNYVESMIFHVKKIISIFIGTFRGKHFNGLRWLDDVHEPLLI